ncbi:MAG: hypothetical protein U9N82_06925 [Thermodesulfobacteriota bacterium]|nr:hypothetical protein [Thermodesulfobacteriota bacterium]
MKKYSDLPMDLADGTLVAVAKHRKVEKVLTLDHRDFNIYRPDHVKHLFPVCPKKAIQSTQLSDGVHGVYHLTA